jgi:hypothetical protein
MGSTFSGESAFTYGRFLSTAGRNFDGECGHTVLGEQVWFSGNADRLKPTWNPSSIFTKITDLA